MREASPLFNAPLVYTSSKGKEILERGVSPSFNIVPPSPLRERGIKGVRVILNSNLRAIIDDSRVI